jgi:hypothetical protein
MPAIDRSEDALMTEVEVAAFLRKAPRTLRAWRQAEYRVRGPRWVKVGGEICYWRSDVLAWLAGRERVASS